MKWLITADWQAQFSNLDACKKAHEQEMALIEKLNIKGHIDLGDLKNEFNPADLNVVDFQHGRKEAIHQSVVYDITLLGNHDMYGQYASEKNWFSLFDSISGHNVKKPQVITLGKCVFACLPFRRSSKLVKKYAEQLFQQTRKKNPNYRYVLLFHCDVASAVYSHITPLKSPSKITLKDLHTDNYDMCFGGHIHLHQYLNKNTMYVGNPFACDAGEIDQEKGFIVYDSETNKVSRILSKVPGLFSWAYVKANKPKLCAGTRIKAVVDCSVAEDYHNRLDKVASAIEHKYPECIAYVVPKFKDKVTKDEQIEVDPESNDYQKIRSYIRATVPDDLRKSRRALLAYISTALGNATTSGIRQSGRILFEKVHAKNVLSFNELKFDFRNKGIVLVQGKNKDSPWSSNGAGKSNLLSMIPIACFGKTFKGEKNDQWASDQNNDKALVTLDITDESGRKLQIIRGRRPVRVKFKINDSDESAGRRHTGKKETQGLIEETLGYTFETLSNSVYLDQTLQNSFLTGTPKDRTELIHKFQNFDRFEIAKKNIGKELSLVRHNRDHIEGELTVVDTLILQANKDIIKARRVAKDEIKSLVQNKQELKKNFVSLRSALKNLRQVHKAREKTLNKKTAARETELELISVDLSPVLGQIVSREAQIAQLDKITKECPICRSPLSKEKRTALQARLLAEIKKLENEKKQLEAREKVLTKELDVITSPLKGLVQEIDNNLASVSTAKTRYEEAVKYLKRAKKRKTIASVRDLTKRKRKLEIDKKRIKRILRNIDEDNKFLTYAQEAMSRDGLPAFLNKLLVPLLNRAASKYSDIFIDKEIQVLFEVEDGQITPQIINLHGGKSIVGQSTGEKAWAGLITSFALREIAHPTNLLILDEPGHGLDVESAKMFGSRLEKLRGRFETILIVSHNQAIVSALNGDNAVTVVKKNRVSYVSNKETA